MESKEKTQVAPKKKVEKVLNLYQKLLAITNEINTVAKNLNVKISDTKSYKAVCEADILEAVKPLENKYGVYSYPLSRKIVDKDTIEKTSQNYKSMSLFMRLEVTYRFVNVEKPEEYIDTIVYADGIDTGDKAPGKAMTYADKYALMKMYKIKTGDDPDKDPSPEEGYTKINYREELIKYCKTKDIDLETLAFEYNLNEKSTENDFKIVLKKLKGNA